MSEIPKAERQMVARARHAFTMLAGLAVGDRLADELWEKRSERYQKPNDH